MLTKYSVKRPFTIFVGVIIAIVFGVVALYSMTPDLMPSVSAPYSVVMTTYPGANAEEIEKEITEPLEQQLATLSKLNDISSVSSDNYSVVTLEFTDDVDMDSMSVDIRDKIDQIEGNFPDTASKPLVIKMNLNMMPVTVAAVGLKGKTPVEVSRFVKDNIEDDLEGIEGVASVNKIGMIDEGIQVVLDQDKIDKVNDDVSDAIRSKFNEGEGKVKGGINQAKKGSSKVSKGKEQINDTAGSATSGFDSAINQAEKAKGELENQRTKLETELDELNMLIGQLEARQAALDPTSTSYERDYENLQQQIDALKNGTENTPGAKQLEEGVEQLKQKISALNDTISDLQTQKSNATFQLGTAYSDLAATQSMLQSTVMQLQSTLSQIESQKQAALDSADMTGIITMDNVSALLNAQNFSMPAGYVTDNDAKILVSVGDKIKDPDELKNLILFDMDIDGVAPIRVKDIATVSYIVDDGDAYAKINGENGVLLSFTKQSTYATATVADNISEEFEKLEKEHKGLTFSPLMDQGKYIHIVINSVFRDLLLGAIFAILVLLFFLRDIRPTAITAISIPVSVIFAIALMYFTGVTINMISLSGLAIGVGMLVDNSIVVIENTYRLRSMGYSPVQAAVSGASQVAGAITASTLTTICVFVPIVFIDGITRELFTDLALTVTYSLLASLIIALTFVPAVAKGLLVRKTAKSVISQNGRVVAWYKRSAAWALLHKKRLVLAALVLLFASSGVLLIRGFEFMPSMSTSQISANVTMPEDSTLEDTMRVNDKISEEVRKIDGVESVGVMLSSNLSSMFGVSSDDENDVRETMLYIVLDDDKAEQGKKVAKVIEKICAENDCEAITSADMDMSEYMGGTGVSIKLYSDDLDKLRMSAMNIEDRLRDVVSLEEVSDITESSTEEVKVTVNKNEAMRNGLTVAQVFQQISSKLSDDKAATKLSTDGETIDVTVGNTTKGGFTLQDLTDMKLVVDKADGSKEKVSLTSIAVISRDASLTSINHDNQRRSLNVTAGVKDDYNITKVTANVKRMINNENLVKPGVEVKYSGENEEIMKSMKKMLLMLIVGIILVYLIMVAQFQSLRSPFIIIFTLPLAFTGGMLALLTTNQVLSVIGMMGFVMLVGIVVNNGIVLVDCINRFRLEGMDMESAIIQAGAVRMRPVLMTATTTILGLIPLALGLGQGAEMVQPVAITCIGGLLYATATTLFIIPIMYSWLARKHMVKIKDEELEIVNV
ncbi:MAG: efflux RND transporter permease subunit [Clostridia bacterium]|nr:efflux RND transporter permease subunit [Clostridia bacterium]